jgi:6-phosphofructokinase 2
MAVVTYTPNPAIDAWATCEAILPTEKIRVRDVRYDPGGGGINVARVLHALGTPVEAVYLSGGRTASLFDGLLGGIGLPGRCVPIEGDTRMSHAVHERSTGREFRFVADGPLVSPAEVRAAMAVLEGCSCDWIVASGSLPRGVGEGHYADVARLARNKGARFALDTSGEALSATVAAGGIDLLKASRGELGSLVGRTLTVPEDIAAAAAAVLAGNRIGRVLVSLGPDGALLATRETVIRVPAPSVAVSGTVGAGDSFLGGFLHGLVSGLAEGDALALAVAAGSAACLRPGTQLVHPGDVRRIMREGSAAGPGSEPGER